MIRDEELLMHGKSSGIVTDGLSIWLDGINNTRGGHDASSTVWEDLSGNGNDFSMVGTVPLSDNHYGFYAGRGQSPVYFKRDGVENMGTYEAVFQYDLSYNTTVHDTVFAHATGGWCFIRSYTSGNICTGSNSSNRKMGVYAKDSRPMIDNICVITCCSDGSLYINGQKQNTGFFDYFSLANSSTFYVGVANHASGGINQYRMYGDIYSIRAYDRVLTEDEVLKNYNADKARFNF